MLIGAIVDRASNSFFFEPCLRAVFIGAYQQIADDDIVPHRAVAVTETDGGKTTAVFRIKISS